MLVIGIKSNCLKNNWGFGGGVMYNKRKIGGTNEQRAKEYLESIGYQIIECNYFTRVGEIDIVAKEDNYLVFVEVKSRSNLGKGYPEEAVQIRKMKSMIKTANYYLLRHGLSFDTPCRFDVVSILEDNITVYKDAFQLDDAF